jgi:endonuclease/exonuclease/phosphatase family metal-dependent hydrolase
MNIHILCFNIHKGVGWGTRKSTLNLIHQQISILHPDIIFLQEVRGLQFEFLASGLWPHFSYGKNAVSPKGHHGNALLSKFPIHSSENIDLTMRRYERRGLLHSVITLPEQNKNIHLLCVHLGLLKKDRRKQLDKIVSFIQQKIPEKEPLVFAGDFNDWSSYATKPLMKKAGLQEAFLTTHGRYARTYPAWAPILKLDRIYFRGFQIIQARRLIKKSWRFLSDHIALEAILAQTE